MCSYFEVGEGSLKGTTYTIKAIAWDQENHLNIFSDTKSYTFRVYKPTTKSGYSSHNVYSYAELSRQYYSHPYVDMVCYVNTYNPGNENNYTRKVYHKFTHQVTPPDDVVRTPGDGSAPTDLPADDTNIRQLTVPSDNGRDSHASFSPNGKSILFKRNDPDNEKCSVNIMVLKSGSIKKVSEIKMN